MNAAAASIRKLPPIQRDLAAARVDLEQHGIAVMSGAFDRADIEAARAAVESLAASERAEGSANIGPGPSQRIWGLIHKAAVFRRIATNAQVLQLMHQILGPRLVLYSMQAHVVPPGGDMDPHFDQMFSPFVSVPILAAAVVMLDDFSMENGATRIAVGAEARRLDEPPPQLDAMAPLEGPKGAVAVYGGLLWHATGVNRSNAPRHGLLIHYCAPWVRQHENYQRTITASALRSYTPELRDLLAIHESEFGRGGWRDA